MKLLKDRILKDGIVKPGNILKVDSFLNHQMDITLINEIGKEFKRRFSDCPITKILTIEASGIGIACIAAQYFNVPVIFAKKAQSVNLDGEMYTTKVESFTHKKVYDVIQASKAVEKKKKKVLEKPVESMSHEEVKELLKNLDKEMKAFARDLEFEKAAELRDEIIDIKKKTNWR